MTNILGGSLQKQFYSRENVADYILEKILANKNKKIGTEWEMFLVDQKGRAITKANGQKIFVELYRIFSSKGYAPSFIYEKDIDGNQTIFGLDIPNLGVITPEIGHQLEFACSVCVVPQEIKRKNDEFFFAIHKAAVRLDHFPIFCGHIPGYAESTEGSYRSRSVEWHTYFHRRFGSQAPRIAEALDATASAQVSLDSGSDKFHDFFQALLLIEPALTLHYANSQRPHVGVSYFPASHMEPIVGVWKTQSPKDAVQAIVDRLMRLEVPFLPDPNHPGLYKAESLLEGRPPTVQDLMDRGRLSEAVLNNIGGFLLSRPAIRRFSQGIIEMRGVDSQFSPERIAQIARHAQCLVYNDTVRTKLLSDYAFMDRSDIAELHRASAMVDREEALSCLVAGIKVSDIIGDILARSERKKGSFHPNAQTTQKSVA